MKKTIKNSIFLLLLLCIGNLQGFAQWGEDGDYWGDWWSDDNPIELDEVCVGACGDNEPEEDDPNDIELDSDHDGDGDNEDEEDGNEDDSSDGATDPKPDPEPEPKPENPCVNDSPAGEGALISSDYGDTSRPPGSSNPHAGIDYAVGTGTPVRAMAGGTVVRSNWSDSYGWVVIIDHGQGEGTTDNIYTLYAHLQTGSFNYNVRDVVNAKDIIANSNNSGNSTGAHLHVSAIQSPKNTALTSPFYSKSKKINPHDLKDKVSNDCN